LTKTCLAFDVVSQPPAGRQSRAPIALAFLARGLSVRPGITGWAQVHGANLVTNREKGALDEYYIRNASLWLDLRIILLTLRAVITGERRSEEAVAQPVRHRNRREAQ
jgi:hypothetical protein